MVEDNVLRAYFDERATVRCLQGVMKITQEREAGDQSETFQFQVKIGTNKLEYMKHIYLNCG